MVSLKKFVSLTTTSTTTGRGAFVELIQEDAMAGECLGTFIYVERMCRGGEEGRKLEEGCINISEILINDFASILFLVFERKISSQIRERFLN